MKNFSLKWLIIMPLIFSVNTLFAATAPTCSTGGLYADFTETGSDSGTGKFSELSVLPDFTWNATGDVKSAKIKTSEYFYESSTDTLIGPEETFGEADSASNVNVRVQKSLLKEGKITDKYTYTNVTFDTPTPSSGWAFSLIDLDNDQVEISAIDASGNSVSNGVIDSWLVEVFDADPKDLAGTTHPLQSKPPFWDTANATLMGYNLSDVMNPVIYNRELTSVTKDAEGASAWFAPNVSLRSMTFTFYSKGDKYTPSYHLYVSSCKGTATNIISGTILNSTSGANIPNATVKLYKDNNSDGQPDAGDIQVSTTTTDASGNYSFNAGDGKYFVLVDSKSLHSDTNVWMEQTLAPKGGLCDDGSGTATTLTATQSCYGGRRGGVFDDISSITTAEHMAVVELNGNDINGVNFGFSADVVTNVLDDGQGTLRQFIQNANAIAGANVMKFVPMEAPNSGTWWSINLTSLLPSLTDAGTTIDGRAYALDGVTLRDENSGTVSGGMKLGTGADGVTDTGEEPTLLAFEKPELEIVINSNEQFGFKVSANDVTIKNIALYGASGLSGDIHDEDNGNIQVEWGIETNNIVIENNFIGLQADGSVPSTKSSAYGVNFYYAKSTNFTISHNYVSTVGKGGIYLAGADISNGVISQNEVQKVDWFGEKDDGIAIESGVHDIQVFENYVHDNEGPGLESYEGGANNYWYNNTVHHNGHGSNATEFFGMRLVGTPGHAYQNHIYENKDAGILVQGSDTSGQRIFKNSIYQNGTIGIDLDVSDDGLDGDGITINNGSVDGNKANNEMDYPVFTTATFSGTTLHIEGYIGTEANQSTFADAMVEVYKVDDDGDSHGEGRWYLGSCTVDGSGNIACDITTSLLSNGDFITATATDISNNTSEFGENHLVSSETFTCDNNAYIFTSHDSKNDPTDVYVTDIISGNFDKVAEDINPTNINAIGYNITDNYIWGYDKITEEVKRVDKNYNITAYTIAELPQNGYHAGDVSRDGILYLFTKFFDSGKTIYKVDVNPTSTTYLKMLGKIDLAQKIEASDFAFNPKDNMLYFAGNTNLFKIDTTTQIMYDLGSLGFNDSKIFVGTFFDQEGYFYIQENSGTVYRIDITNPANPNPHAEVFSSFTVTHYSDGARCAYSNIGDKPIIEIEDSTVVEGDSANTEISFKISADRVMRSALSIDYTFSAGTAHAGSDYHDSSDSVLIPAGSDSVILTLPMVITDNVQEDDEDFFIHLSSSAARFLDDEAKGSIVNDDYDIKLNGATVSDGNITTQIVGKPFSLTISAVDPKTDLAMSDVNITRVDLIHPDGSVIDASWWSGLITTDVSGQVTLLGLSYDKAVKEAMLRIYADYKGTYHDSLSLDAFAIRPDRFTLTLPTQKIAGENFIVGVKAKEYGTNDAASNYNETEGSSYSLTLEEHNASTGCAMGTISPFNKNFHEGAISQTVSYSEVGVLDMNISETLGSEFAIVDDDDTPETDRLIEPTSASMHFVPSRFVISSPVVENEATGRTYYADYADTKDQGAKVSATIEAQNSLGEVTTNYTSGCYSKDTDLNIAYSVMGDISAKKITWYDVNNDTDSGVAAIALTSGGAFDFPIADANFTAGVANVSMKFNLGRSITTPMNPLILSVDTLTATDSDGIITPIPYSVTTPVNFYYGRLHSPDISVVGKQLTAKIYHEVYCKDVDRSIFGLANKHESVDSIHWYIVEGTNDFSNVQTLYGSTVTGTGLNTISLQASKLPFRDTVTFEPESWLQHKLFSTTNRKEKFKVTFSPDAAKWAGKGGEGKTIEMKAAKSGNQKIDW